MYSPFCETETKIHLALVQTVAQNRRDDNQCARKTRAERLGASGRMRKELVRPQGNTPRRPSRGQGHPSEVSGWALTHLSGLPKILKSGGVWDGFSNFLVVARTKCTVAVTMTV
jgi:hypothetical protein